MLDKLGWIEGRNIQIDVRFSDGNPEHTRAAAAELIALAPDVLLAYANPAVSALQPLTRTIPIVFTQVSAPIESGSLLTIHESLAGTKLPSVHLRCTGVAGQELGAEGRQVERARWFSP